MKKALIIMLVAITMTVLLGGCTVEEKNWGADNISTKKEAKNLSHEWKSGVYSNSHIGLYLEVPETWSEEQLTSAEIEAYFNAFYTDYFESSGITANADASGIKIASAYREKTSATGEYLEIYIEPWVTDNTEEYMQKTIGEFEEIIASMDEQYKDMMQIGELTEVEVDGGILYAVGMRADAVGSVLYQMNYGYYKNGYMIILSFGFEENSYSTIETIIQSVRLS